jgi:anti-anti-sigma regulatory factor
VIAAPQREIIVDLACLEFIDSSGVAALVRVRTSARLAVDASHEGARPARIVCQTI